MKDPVKFPESMGPEFKSFLKGLLNKVPSERLSWPELLNHAFIKENDQEKAERKKRQERYNIWMAYHVGEEGSKNNIDMNKIANDAVKANKIEVSNREYQSITETGKT